MLGCALVGFAQDFGPRSHSFPKLYLGKVARLSSGHAQSPQPFKGERQSRPGLTLRGHASGGEEGNEPPHQFAAAAAIIHPHENEGTGVGRGPRVKDCCLQVFDF